MSDFIRIENDNDYLSMIDSHDVIRIEEKVVLINNIGKIVCGDTNSQILTFEIDRYYDGIDLSTKNISFIYKNSSGTNTDDAINVQYNDEVLRFSWLIPYALTATSGNVVVAIQLHGTEDGRTYSFKTTNFKLQIEPSLDGTTITVDAPSNWYVEINNRLTAIENQGGVAGEIKYTSLTNKPSINNVTLEGNLTSDNLGLVSKEYVDNAVANVSVNVTGLATEEYVNTALEGKAEKVHTHNEYLTEHQDISGKADVNHTHTMSEISDFTVPDLGGYAKKDHSHTMSDITDYTIPDMSEYVKTVAVETLLEGKADATHTHDQYLTEHQSLDSYALKSEIPEAYDDTALVEMIEDVETSLSDKADKTELHSHTNKDVLDGITADKVASWDAKATESFVTNAIAQAQLDGSDVDLSGLATVDQLNLKADKDHNHDGVYQPVGNYLTSHQDISGKADVDHTHTLSDVTDYAAPDLTVYAKTSDVNIALSGKADTDHTHDEYLTEHQDISGKSDVGHKHVLSDITDYEEPDLSSYVTETALTTTLADYVKSADIVEYDDTALTERVSDVETALASKADTSAIPDVSNFVEKETGKGLFSGSYNDLTNKPTIPSVDGLVSENTLNTTLANYAKSDDIPTTLPANGGNAQTVNGHTIESDVPSNAVFTDTIYDDAALANRVQTIEDDTVTKAHTHANAVALNSVSNEFDGKKILIVGDSVMAGAGWAGGYANLIQEKYPTATVVNSAVGGSTLAHSSSNYILTQITSSITADFVPDIILMDGGGNDMMYKENNLGIELGELTYYAATATPTFDKNTTLGALEDIFYTLEKNYPAIKIYFIGLYQLMGDINDGNLDYPSYETQLKWWNKVKACCVKHSVPYIDLFSSGNFNTSNYGIFTAYMADSLHANEAGYRRLFPIVEAAVNGAPCNTEVVPETKDFLADKTIVFLGDSVTVGMGWQNEIGDTTNKYGWAHVLQENHPTATVKNLAISGACLAHTGSYTDVVAQYAMMYNPDEEDFYVENPDYIIFSGGGNDYFQSIDKGALCYNYAPTYENITTTIGALEFMFMDAYTRFPSARKGFIITHILSTEAEEYYEAVRQVCKKWAIPILDFSQVGEINPIIEGVYNTYFSEDDHVHPNQKCYREILAPKVEKWLESEMTLTASTSTSTSSSSTDPLEGKIIICIGDSLMQGTGWSGGFANCIIENHPEAKVYNIAVGGSTLVPTEANNYIYQQFKAYKDAGYTAPDLILFDGGGNDCLYRLELGTGKLDSCDINGTQDTVCDALEYLIYEIKTAFPTTKLLYVTSPLTKQSDDTSVIPSIPTPDVQLEYLTAREKVLEKWGIPKADIRREGNLTSCLTSQTSLYYAESDSLHLNEAGYRYVSPVIEDALRKLF